jgi:hypothetical protein
MGEGRWLKQWAVRVPSEPAGSSKFKQERKGNFINPRNPRNVACLWKVGNRYASEEKRQQWKGNSIHFKWEKILPGQREKAAAKTGARV